MEPNRFLMMMMMGNSIGEQDDSDVCLLCKYLETCQVCSNGLYMHSQDYDDDDDDDDNYDYYSTSLRLCGGYLLCNYYTQS